jgi:hypothetical protein
MTRSPTYCGADIVQREALRLAVMPQPPSEGQEIHRGRRDIKICHAFTIAKESLIFPSRMR